MEASIATLPVKVVPASSRNRIAGWLGDTLKITVTAPAESGKANAAVAATLATALGVPASWVRVLRGLERPLLSPIRHVPGARSFPRGFLEVKADLEHPKRDAWLAQRDLSVLKIYPRPLVAFS